MKVVAVGFIKVASVGCLPVLRQKEGEEFATNLERTTRSTKGQEPIVSEVGG